ncbi:MucR family transcriptional regulator [Methylobacterium durans]|uniref:MucR family transcriptional regulator n=1 Tax=Methylobacterium durans TaxID=2202825 RepID=A0A2U8W5J2_9HYPH|nr:MucR family transcriptional regulator [Methylobacterium durans]AWN40898.1 MucR family transcriptional regulator [Methylobacterium durans]
MSEVATAPHSVDIERTVDVVSAYVSNNSVPTADLPALITSVHDALKSLANGPVQTEADVVEKPSTAQVRKSIRPDGLISFIDGKSYKTLKRHLTKHGLDPHSYRERYGLPADYPTTSANYSAQRSALAKSLGLGQPGRLGTDNAAAATPAEPHPAPGEERRRPANGGSGKRASRKATVAA